MQYKEVIKNPLPKLAIFVSGNGSNMASIIESSKNKSLRAEVKVVISNDPEAEAINKAKELGIETIIINHKFYKDRKQFEKVILSNIGQYKLDLICLAGFMRLFSDYFISKCKLPIINIHPSLLPKYKGLEAFERAFKAKDKEAGCTMHHVIEEMDEGEIILQKKFEIDYKLSLAENKKTLHKLEHLAFIEAIKIVLKNTIAK
jgi:phosphoribosylglycinamide formyltransferase 1